MYSTNQRGHGNKQGQQVYLYYKAINEDMVISKASKYIYTIRRMQNGLVENNYSWTTANSTTKLSSLELEDALQSLLFDTLSIQQQCRGLVLQGSTEYNLKGHVF